MQFQLSKLFGAVAVCAVVLALISPFFRHWDLRSYYLGFYGRGPIPAWATGTGADDVSRTLGEFMGLVWNFGPWVGLFGFAAILGGFALKMKGVAQ